MLTTSRHYLSFVGGKSTENSPTPLVSFSTKIGVGLYFRLSFLAPNLPRLCPEISTSEVDPFKKIVDNPELLDRV